MKNPLLKSLLETLVAIVAAVSGIPAAIVPVAANASTIAVIAVIIAAAKILLSATVITTVIVAFKILIAMFNIRRITEFKLATGNII